MFVCVQPDGGVKPDTVGPPVTGVEIRLTDYGEILIRSPGLFHEYYKSPDATREAKDPEGWFHTGDAGYFDAEGHLKIIDRAKDVGKLVDGTLFAPKYIENKLKFFPTSRRRSRSVTGARGLRLHQHRHRSSRQLGRKAQPALHRLPRPRR